MAKGHKGESCIEAIRTSINKSEILSFNELFSRLKSRGNWSDDKIWQNIMAVIVNLIPAKYHWEGTKQFLYLRGDGRYELYDSQKHPPIIES
jgi:hypothetical protein